MKVAKRTVDEPFDIDQSISAFLGEPTQGERFKEYVLLTKLKRGQLSLFTSVIGALPVNDPRGADWRQTG